MKPTGFLQIRVFSSFTVSFNLPMIAHRWCSAFAASRWGVRDISALPRQPRLHRQIFRRKRLKRRSDGDESVQIADGAAMLNVVTGTARVFRAEAGIVAIVPQGAWHCFQAPSRS